MLFPKPTHKKKKPKNNKRITEYYPCYMNCGRPATETHEIFQAANRQHSIEDGMQIKVCHECHERIHAGGDISLALKAEWQKKWMIKFPGKSFRERYGKNYL
jgi:hypothetical protein